MQLDVLVPTYNRSELLARALCSLRDASVPDAMKVRVTVLDNNSIDETRATVEAMRPDFDNRLDYIFEPRQGKSHALNTGIERTSGDLIGIIDDDEEIDGNWYARVYQAFDEQPELDFIGGPYIPRWGAERPAWLPDSYGAVIGWVDGGDHVTPFDANYPGMLMGGNCVLTRRVLERVGGFSTALGRTARGLMCCEDEDMYRRLLLAKAYGLYLPDLIIYHYVPPARLTREYYRRWCFWNGVSRGWLGKTSRESVAYLGGVPRYLYGNAARGLAAIAAGILRAGDGQAKKRFTRELAVWDLVGFFYGVHFYRPDNPAGETHKKMKEQTAL